MIKLSYPYMTTGKTIALTRPTFVGKVMSFLFNMLPRLVIGFLPRKKKELCTYLGDKHLNTQLQSSAINVIKE